jgi:hypothetical protein
VAQRQLLGESTALLLRSNYKNNSIICLPWLGQLPNALWECSRDMSQKVECGVRPSELAEDL